MKLKPCIYIAGPFRCPSQHMPGQQDNWGIQQNIMRAADAALQVWRMGGAALCPHLNTAFFQNAAKDEVWLEGDLALLNKCDAVLMIPGWARSTGARAEREFAIKAYVPVFDSLPAIQRFINRWEDHSELEDLTPDGRYGS